MFGNFIVMRFPPLCAALLALYVSASTFLLAETPLTVVLHPVADSTVLNNEGIDLKHGTQTSLALQKGGGRDFEALLKFEITNPRTDIARATLRLFVSKIVKGNPTTPVGIWTTTPAWSESEVTYRNRPTVGPHVADFSGIPTIGQWMEADVTKIIKGPGTYSFRLAAKERYKLVIPSREAKDEAEIPELSIAYGPRDSVSSADSGAKPPGIHKTVTIRPADDVWLDANASGPTDQQLHLGKETSREAFLAFDLPGVNDDVTGARLRIHISRSAPGTLSVYTVANGWDEKNLTWDRRPAALPSKPLAEMKLPGKPGWMEFDVTSLVTGTGRYSFILRTDASGEVLVDARESGNNAPEFIVVHQAGLNKRVTDVIASGERILARYGEQRLARDGILDVTQAPYCADPTGRRDSTLAIQRALNEGRDARCTTYLPRGIYVVSDTIEGVSPNYLGGGYPGLPLRRGEIGCVLQGSSDPKERAIIKLAANARGFADPERPKPVIHFWAVNGVPPNVYEKSNAHFSQQIRNLSLDLGGNPGAIGIEFLACEDSSLQSVHVEATGAFAGFKDGLGSGGGMHNLSANGGRYGAYLTNTQPTCSLSHANFVNQTIACVYNNSRGPLVMPGAVLSPSSGAAAVILAGSTRGDPWNASLCLVDSRIEMPPGSTAPAIRGNRSIYLNQVYIRNAANLLVIEDAGPGITLAGRSDGWCHVAEYAVAATVLGNALQRGASAPPQKDAVYIDGRERSSPPPGSAWEPVDGSSIPADLQSRHTWSGSFPGVGMGGMLNARDFGATGDGDRDDFTDQSPALQRAIDEASARNQPLFVPRGIYRISRTLDLRANTTLVGVSHISTCFVPIIDPARYPDGDFLNGNDPRPLFRTADDAAATTRLGYVGIRLPMATPDGLKTPFYPAYAILWRAGRNSVINSIRSVHVGGRGDGIPLNSPLFIFRGNGGGRAYGFKVTTTSDFESMTSRYTNCLIDGTHEPLAIYHFQPQGANKGYTGAEIRNASHVDAFGLKYEGSRPVVTIRNSDHIRLFGESGGGAPKALIAVEKSRDFLLSNLYPLRGKNKSGNQDIVHDDSIVVGDSHQVLLYKRGSP